MDTSKFERAPMVCGNHACQNCVAQFDEYLCDSLPSCFEDDQGNPKKMIWIKKEEAKDET